MHQNEEFCIKNDELFSNAVASVHFPALSEIMGTILC